MLDMRRRLEAEGLRRMIGSDRLLLTLDCSGLPGGGTGRVARVLDAPPGRECELALVLLLP